jgi:hypothetical protein
MTHRTLLVATAVAGAILIPDMAVASVAFADPPYRNCSEAHADGRYNIPQDDPAYSPKLDRDHDGLACEPNPYS